MSESATELVGGFRGAAGDPIHVFRWATAGHSRGDIVLLHGYGDYSSRYRDFARELNSAGYDVHGIDFAGFGRSGGDRGLISVFKNMQSDVAKLVREIVGSRPVRPIHTMGHSIGGVIAVSMLSMDSCRELITTGIGLSPLVAVSRSPPTLPVVRAIAGLVPAFSTRSVEPEQISNEPQTIADFVADPFIFHSRVPLRSGVQMMSAAEALLADAPSIDQPVLVMCGTRDVFADPVGSRELYSRARQLRQTNRRDIGGWHELLFDKHRDEVKRELYSWLAAHS